MAYLFKEKFNLSDLVAAQVRPSKLVLVMESEEFLLSLYSYYLSNHNLRVLPCRQVDALHKAIFQHQPDLLIINTGTCEHLAAFIGLLKELRGKFQSLPVVTIGHNTTGQELSLIMTAGISGHIDRKLTKPKDVVHIVKAILND